MSEDWPEALLGPYALPVSRQLYKGRVRGPLVDVGVVKINVLQYYVQTVRRLYAFHGQSRGQCPEEQDSEQWKSVVIPVLEALLERGLDGRLPHLGLLRGLMRKTRLDF